MENALINGPKPLTAEAMNLPLSNVDKMLPMGPIFLFQLFSKILGFNLKKCTLPDGLMGKEKIPEYALHEFHNLPNGYYSVHFSEGYSNGFNFFMLGEMERIRKSISRELASCTAVLDLGCGDGSSTKILADEGIKEVWGLDVSPYLLAQAMHRNKGIKFVHGAAEATEFLDQSFDGICTCWVFHEVPTSASDAIIKECYRLLKPGGKLVIMEPSKQQYKNSYFDLYKKFGLRGMYFRLLARIVHEPFINEWQNKNIKEWVERHGLELVSNEVNLPEEKIVARKPF